MCYITAGGVNNLKQHCIKRFFCQSYLRQEPKTQQRNSGLRTVAFETVRLWIRAAGSSVTSEMDAGPPCRTQKAGRRQSVGSHFPGGPRGPGGPGGPLKVMPGGPEQENRHAWITQKLSRGWISNTGVTPARHHLGTISWILLTVVYNCQHRGTRTTLSASDCKQGENNEMAT